MSKLAKLREQRNILSLAANQLNDKYPADQRMPKADADALDAKLAEIEAVDLEIDRCGKLAALAAEKNESEDLLNKATRDPSKQSDDSKGLKAYLAGGIGNLSLEQRNAMQGRQTQEMRATILAMPQNAMSTTTPSEGGYTVATEYMRELEKAMKAYGGILQVCDEMRTGSGATMNFPTVDATAEIGEIVGQNAAATALDTTFGNATLDVYRYSSKKIALPWELVQDSFIDIEAYIQEVLATRLGRILSAHLTTGTGSGQPRGIVTAATLGKTGTTGQTLSVIYDDIVDLEHSVDPAYRSMPGVGFMMHDTSLRVVRKIKDSQGRPIFVPGYESGVPGGAPDRLLNRPITISQEMPVMAANAKSILFGAFKKYKHRKVMDLTMFRFTDSAFSLNGQVGFCAFQRDGGNLIDVGGAVKYYANSAT